MKFTIVSGDVIHEILSHSHQEIKDIVYNTYNLHENKKTINPDSYFLRFNDKPESRIIALPAAIVGEKKYSGIKWIASYPENVKSNLQRASAVLLLNDYETGYPFACLESSQISAHRTAASAVIAAEHLSPHKIKTSKIAIIGAGIISKTICLYLKNLGWDIDMITVFDLDKTSANNLCEFIKNELNINSRIIDNLNDTVNNATHVFFATTASAPYIMAPEIFSSGQVILNISLRDLSVAVIKNSYNILDDIDHCLKANTSPHLASIELGNTNFINGTIAQVFQKKIKIKNDKPIIFSPFGLGILDLAVGYFLYQKATKDGKSYLIDNFFPTFSRW
ncbi:2,3-diaminopropionate biosynthesis protein SbnB [Lonsdalea quercina]|uniref:2,3-diaminopropionate biosynthesis protein SbnB n=1 Tax=Lonsdalea quercina TaxID=71657 RepID=UPI003974D51A